MTSSPTDSRTDPGDADRMRRLEAMIDALPQTERVDVEGWGGEPTFRVRGKVFVFTSPDATSVGVKLPRAEAEAVVATDPAVTPMGYGLGRHGWVTVRLDHEPGGPAADRWAQIEEWVRTSYTLIAPRSLARLVEA